MEKDHIPQDNGALSKLTREVCYAVDANGNYVTELSSGWEVKAAALGLAWEDIRQRIEDARQKVLNKQASPLLFFMEWRLMDIPILSAYTGFWQWTVKRHMKYKVYQGLSDKTLRKYADAFNVSLDDLKTMTIHEE